MLLFTPQNISMTVIKTISIYIAALVAVKVDYVHPKTTVGFFPLILIQKINNKNKIINN